MSTKLLATIIIIMGADAKVCFLESDNGILQIFCNSLECRRNIFRTYELVVTCDKYKQVLAETVSRR